MYRCNLFILAILLPFLSMGQARRALNMMEKFKYEQAEEILYKSIRKDSLNPGEKYVLSLLYSTENYYNYNVDSAHFYVLQSIHDFQESDEKTLEKLQKDEITQHDMIRQKDEIEKFIFNQVKKENSEEGYKEYIEKYLSSKLNDSAVWYRNKAAYFKAMAKDTWQAYQSFILKYPDSEQFQDATNRYNKLIYEDKTKNGMLESYQQFLKDQPETPYRKEAEHAIFNIMTGTHSPEDYLSFAYQYPESYLVKVAAARLYHAEKGKAGSVTHPDFIGKYLSADSLSNLEKLESTPLFTVYNSQFQFMDGSGKYWFGITSDMLLPGYKCGNISDPLIVICNNGLSNDKDPSCDVVNREGHILYSDYGIDYLEDLGFGFVKFRKRGRYGLLFKTGELISEPFADDFRILQGQFIAYQLNDLWGIMSINKLKLTDPDFADIENFATLIRITDRNGKFALIKPSKLYPLLHKGEIQLDFAYDDAELLGGNQILVYSGDAQGIINEELDEIITPEEQELIPLKQGLIIEYSKGYRFLPTKIEINPTVTWTEMDFINEGWLSLKGPNGWILASLRDEKVSDEYLDSLRLLNRGAVLAYKNGEKMLVFQGGKQLTLNKSTRLEVVASPPEENIPTVYYEVLKEKDKKRLLNSAGDTLLADTFKEVRAFGDEYLVVSESKGSRLFDSRGNQLLNPFFDGIANYSDGGVTLLKNAKLGYYRLADSVYIPPIYLKSVRPYSDSLFIAYSGEGYGIIDRAGRTITGFLYNNIEYFNDSIAWVEEDGSWNLFDIIKKEVIQKEVSSFFEVEDLDENYLYYQTPEGKGVINRKTGTIIKATFNDIINVGSREDPVFLAEKYIEEADYYVVVYYDKNGNILFRRGYESQEYEDLICEK